MPNVTVVDYELNNVFSVCRAFESVGSRVSLSRDPAAIVSAERLVLPGVGSFRDGMERLRKLDLIEPIQEYARSGRPLLGFCLGMQLLADAGEEFGVHAGLGLIHGRVVRFPRETREKVPHVGWNSLLAGNDSSWKGTILNGVTTGADVYFSHSYFVTPDDPMTMLGVTEYGGVRFTSVLKLENLYGCQFHPEKSGPSGLRIIENFALRA